MGKPGLVVRHSCDGEAVGLPGNRVGREQGFITVGGDASRVKVALSNTKGAGGAKDINGLRLGFLDLPIDKGLHPLVEHALCPLALSHQGSSELGVEATASLLEKLESFQGGRGMPSGNVGLDGANPKGQPRGEGGAEALGSSDGVPLLIKPFQPGKTL